MSTANNIGSEWVSPGHHRAGGDLAIRVGQPTDAHGLNRRPSKADRTPIRPELLAEFNTGTQRAIEANRDHEAREKHLDSLYSWREVTA